MSIAQAAAAIGVDRATARRLLLTLVEEEFVATDGNVFYLRPRALQIGHAYLRSSDLAGLCSDRLQHLSEALSVTASAGVLSDGHALYIARSVRQSPVTLNVEVGMKVPLYRSSIGRVLLAAMDPAQIRTYLTGVHAARVTEKSIVSTEALAAAINEVRRVGYAIVDEELELNLRTIAVAVHDGAGRVVAAINAATIGSGSSREDLEKRLLQPLIEASRDIELALK